jgi:DNA polymerase-3 subunit beta
MKAEGGTIKFTATNLEMAINCSVRGKVDEQGEYTIPSKLFYDYVSLLPNETVKIEVNGEDVLLQCGSHKTCIHGLNASEFPLVPHVEGERIFQIPVEELKEALAHVLFSVATNESRPELTGVSFFFFSHEGEGRLTLAATDSYRLAEKTIPIVTPVSDPFSIIVPSKTLQEVARILSVFKDDVELPSTISISLASSQLVFSYGSVELVSRTIEGGYPDYKQIIPTQFQTKAIVDREDFMKAVKTASLFSRLGLFDVTLALDPVVGEISVSANDATRGDNMTKCSANISGVPNTVTVNHRYLLDGLQAISSEQVVFEMIDASNPCLLTPQGEKDSYRYIVMPIKQ